MVMTAVQAKDTLGDLLNGMREAGKHYDEMKQWRDGETPMPYKPRDTDDDFDALMEKAETRMIGLVLRVLTQSIELRSYSPGIEDDGKLMLAFSQNRMQTRQKRLYQAAMTSGMSYSSLELRGGRLRSKVYSAKNAFAVFGDAEADEFADYAVTRGQKLVGGGYELTLMDSDAIYRFREGEGGTDLMEIVPHGLGVTPIVRFTGEMDAEGDVQSEVEPLIEPQASLNQTKADRLVAQSYASWVVRVLSGVEKPDDEYEARMQNIELSMKRLILANDPAAKAQTFGTTNLQQYIDAGKSDKQELAVLAQVPQKTIIGAQSNQSDGADALAAEEASTQRKLHNYETSFGESWGTWFRLAGGLLGINGGLDDYRGAVDWRDSEIRSMSQMADALGKIATQLQVPVKALWNMIPNVSPDTVRQWEEMAAADPYNQALNAAGLGI